MKQIFIINFKTYKKGKSVLKLAKEIEKVDKDIIVGVSATSISEVSKKTKLKVYTEHVDPFAPGRNTGFILPEEVKANGANGTFLNHSEHKISFGILKKTILRCKEVGLKIAVFAPNVREAKRIEKLKPDFLIFEPPELVSGKISVSSAKPDLIKKISKEIKMKFLVGAGIHKREDVENAIKLGASGVAVSSVITKSRNPSKELKKLLGK